MTFELFIWICFLIGILYESYRVKKGKHIFESAYHKSKIKNSDFFSILLIIGLGIMILIGVGYPLPNEKNIEIISLNKESEVSGSFIIGTGQIDEEIVYYAYKKAGDGYELIKIPLNEGEDKLRIYEKDGQPRYIKRVIGNKSLLDWDYKIERKLIIPENSIVRKFNP